MANEDKNSVLGWPKRVAKSIAFGAVDALRDTMPTLFSTIETNRDAAKKLYNDTISNRQPLQKLKQLQDTYIFKPAKQLMKNLKEDIKSGVFYHPERAAEAQSQAEEDMMKEMLSAVGMEDMMGMLTGEEDLPESEMADMPIKPVLEVTSGDALVASAITREQRHATNSLAKIQSDVAEAQIQVTRTLGNFNLQILQKQTNILEHGFANVAKGFNNIAEFSNNVIMQHIENSTQFYQAMTDLTQQNNAILKEIVDMKRNKYKAEASEEDPDKPASKSDLFKNGIFDLGAYIKIIGQNIDEGLMMANIALAGIQGVIAGIVANPVQFATKQIFKTLLGPGLRSAMRKFDEGITGWIATALAKLGDFGNDPKSGILGTIAKFFGITVEDTNIRKTKLTDLKEPRSWDGEDHFYLTNVIPSYLSNIEAALTGNDARYFNPMTGKFTTVTAMRERYDTRDYRSAEQNAGDLKQSMRDVLQTTMDIRSKEDLETFNTALNDYILGIQRNGGLHSKEQIEDTLTDEKYGKDENLRRMLYQALVTVNELNPSLLAAVNGRIIAQKTKESKMLREGKFEEMDPSQQVLATNADLQFRGGKGFAIGSNDVTVNKPGILGSSFDDSATNSLLSWQEKIYQVLVQIRDFGGMGGGFNPISSMISMFKSIIPFMHNDTVGEKAIKDAIKSLEKQEKAHRKEQKKKQNQIEKDRARYERDPNRGISADSLSLKTRDKYDLVRLVLDYDTYEDFYNSPAFAAHQEEFISSPDILTRLEKLFEAKKTRNLQKTEDLLGAYDDITYNEESKSYGSETNLQVMHTRYNETTKESDKKGIADKYRDEMTSLRKDKQKMHMLGERVNRFSRYNSVGFLDSFLGSDITIEEADYKINEILGSANGADLSLFQQLSEAATLGDKMGILSANISKLAAAPRSMLISVLNTADKMMYDFMFGKPTGDKGPDGSVIHGLFGKMTSKMEDAGDAINTGINNIVDSLGLKTDTLFNRANSFITNWLNFNPRQTFDTLKEQGLQFFNPFYQGATEGSKSFFSDIGSALSGTMRDLSNFFQHGTTTIMRAEGTEFAGEPDKGEMAIVSKGEAILYPKYNPFNENRDSMPDYGSIGSPNITKTGLTYLPEGSAVIPSNKNPWNPNRSTSRPAQDAINENRIQEKIRKEVSHYAEGSEQTPQKHEKLSETSQDITKDTAELIQPVLSYVMDKLSTEENDSLIEDLFKTLKIDKKDISSMLGLLAGSKAMDLSNYLELSSANKEFAEEIFKKLWETKTVMENPELKTFLAKFAQTVGIGRLKDENEILYEDYNRKTGFINGIEQFFAQLTGKDPGRALSETRRYIIHNTPEMMKGGMAGALAGTLFPLGGPLIGAMGGVAVSLLSRNKSFMNYLFGTEIVDAKTGEVTGRHNDGLISAKFMKSLEKYIPDAKKYGITGTLVGLITPFGPLGGLMAGIAASYIKNNDAANKFLFGAEGDEHSGLFSKNLRSKIKKAIPSIATATLGTLFLGPFGIMGNAALGTAIGFISTTETFKKIMLGAKDKNGIRHGGLAGAIKRHITNPLKRNAKQWFKDMGKWFKDELFKPLSRTIGPVGKLIGSVAKDGVKYLFNAIHEKIAGPGSLFEKAFDWLFWGVKKSGGFGKFLLQKALSPVTGAAKLLEKYVGNKAREINYSRGNTGDETAAEVVDQLKKMKSTDRKTQMIYENIAEMSDRNPTFINPDAKTANLLNMAFGHEGAIAVKERQSAAYGHLTSSIAEATQTRESLENAHSDLIDVAKMLSQSKSSFDVEEQLEEVRKILDYHNVVGDDRKAVMKMFYDNAEEMRQAAFAEEMRNQGLESHKTAVDELKKNYGFEDMDREEFVERILPVLSKGLANELRLQDKFKEAAIKEQKDLGLPSRFGPQAETPEQQAGRLFREKMLRTTEMGVRILATIGGYDPGILDSISGPDQSFRRDLKKFDINAAYTQRGIDYVFRKENAQTLENDKELTQKAKALNVDKTIPGISVENLRQTVGRNNRRYAATLINLGQAYDEGNRAVIQDIEKILELDHTGNGKLIERIGKLTIAGLDVPSDQYEIINDLSEVGFNCAFQLVSLGVTVGSFDIFKDIGEDNQYEADLMVEIAKSKLQYENDEGNIVTDYGANFLTAEVLARHTRSLEGLPARAYGSTKNFIEQGLNIYKEGRKWKPLEHEIGQQMRANHYTDPDRKEELAQGVDVEGNEVSNFTGHYGGKLGTIQDIGKTSAWYARKVGNFAKDSVIGVSDYVTHGGVSKIINAGKTFTHGRTDADFAKDTVANLVDETLSDIGFKKSKEIQDAIHHYSYEIFSDLFLHPKHRGLYVTLAEKLYNGEINPLKVAPFIDHILHGRNPFDEKDFTTNEIPEEEVVHAPKHDDPSTQLSGVSGPINNKAFGSKYISRDIPKYSFGTMWSTLKNAGLGFAIGGGFSNNDKKKKDEENDVNPTIETSDANKIIKSLEAFSASAAAIISDKIFNDTTTSSTALGSIDLGNDGKQIVNTAYGPVEYVKSSTDGQMMRAHTKSNAEVESKEEADIDRKKETIEVLKDIKDAIKDGFGTTISGAKKKSKGLLDLLSSVVSLPGEILSSLSSSLFALPLVGGLIAAVLSPISKIFGKFKNFLFGTSEAVSKFGASASAAKKGAVEASGLIMKAVPTPIKLILAGLLAFFGINMYDAATASEATHSPINGLPPLDKDGNPLPINDPNYVAPIPPSLTQSAWNTVTNSPWLMSAAGLGVAGIGSRLFTEQRAASIINDKVNNLTKEITSLKGKPGQEKAIEELEKKLAEAEKEAGKLKMNSLISQVSKAASPITEFGKNNKGVLGLLALATGGATYLAKDIYDDSVYGMQEGDMTKDLQTRMGMSADMGANAYNPYKNGFSNGLTPDWQRKANFRKKNGASDAEITKMLKTMEVNGHQVQYVGIRTKNDDKVEDAKDTAKSLWDKAKDLPSSIIRSNIYDYIVAATSGTKLGSGKHSLISGTAKTIGDIVTGREELGLGTVADLGSNIALTYGSNALINAFLDRSNDAVRFENQTLNRFVASQAGNAAFNEGMKSIQEKYAKQIEAELAKGNTLKAKLLQREQKSKLTKYVKDAAIKAGVIKKPGVGGKILSNAAKVFQAPRSALQYLANTKGQLGAAAAGVSLLALEGSKLFASGEEKKKIEEEEKQKAKFKQELANLPSLKPGQRIEKDSYDGNYYIFNSNGTRASNRPISKREKELYDYKATKGDGGFLDSAFTSIESIPILGTLFNRGFIGHTIAGNTLFKNNKVIGGSIGNTLMKLLTGQELTTDMIKDSIFDSARWEAMGKVFSWLGSDARNAHGGVFNAAVHDLSKLASPEWYKNNLTNLKDSFTFKGPREAYSKFAETKSTYDDIRKAFSGEKSLTYDQVIKVVQDRKSALDAIEDLKRKGMSEEQIRAKTNHFTLVEQYDEVLKKNGIDFEADYKKQVEADAKTKTQQEAIKTTEAKPDTTQQTQETKSSKPTTSTQQTQVQEETKAKKESEEARKAEEETKKAERDKRIKAEAENLTKIENNRARVKAIQDQQAAIKRQLQIEEVKTKVSNVISAVKEAGTRAIDTVTTKAGEFREAVTPKPGIIDRTTTAVKEAWKSTKGQNLRRFAITTAAMMVAPELVKDPNLTTEQLQQRRELAPGLQIVDDGKGNPVVVDSEGKPLEDQSAVQKEPPIPPGTKIVYDESGKRVLIDENTGEPAEDQSPVIPRETSMSEKAFTAGLVARQVGGLTNMFDKTRVINETVEKGANKITGTIFGVSEHAKPLQALGNKALDITKKVTDLIHNPSAGLMEEVAKAKTAIYVENSAKAARDAAKITTEVTSAATKGAEEAAEKAGRIQTIIKSAKENLEKLYKFVSKFCPSGMMEAVRAFGSKFLEMMVKPQFMQKLLDFIARQTAGLAAGAVTMGLGTVVLTGVFAVTGFMSGWNSADEMLEIPTGSATLGMKIFCGLITALTAAPGVLGIAMFILNETGATVKVLTRLGFTKIFGFDEKDLSDLKKESDVKEEDKQYNSFEEAAQAFSSENMIDWTKKAARGVISAVVGSASSMASAVAEQASKAMEGISKLAGDAKDYVIDKASIIGNKIVEGVQSGAHWLKDKASQGWQAAKELGSKAVDIGKDLLGDVGNFFTSLVPDPSKLHRGGPNQGKGKIHFKQQTDSDIANIPIYAPGDTYSMTVADRGCGPISAVNAAAALGVNIDPKAAVNYSQGLGKGVNYYGADDGVHPQAMANIGLLNGLQSSIVDTSYGLSRINDNNITGTVQIDGSNLSEASRRSMGLGPEDAHYITLLGNGRYVDPSRSVGQSEISVLPSDAQNAMSNMVLYRRGSGKRKLGRNKQDITSKHEVMADTSKLIASTFGYGKYGRAAIQDISTQDPEVSLDPKAPQNLPIFKMWDPRWADKTYPGGSGNIITYSGCGPTSLAMVSTWATGQVHLPDQVAEAIGNAGYHVSGGTSGDAYSWYAKQHGFDFKHTEDWEDVEQALKNGIPVINSQGHGKFASGDGHIIVLAGTRGQDDYIVYDPNRYIGTEKWTKNDILENLGFGYWIPTGTNIGNKPIDTNNTNIVQPGDSSPGLIDRIKQWLTPEQVARKINQLIEIVQGKRTSLDADLLEGGSSTPITTQQSNSTTTPVDTSSSASLTTTTDKWQLLDNSATFMSAFAKEKFGQDVPTWFWRTILRAESSDNGYPMNSYQANNWNNFGGMDYDNWMVDYGGKPATELSAHGHTRGVFPDVESGLKAEVAWFCRPEADEWWKSEIAAAQSGDWEKAMRLHVAHCVNGVEGPISDEEFASHNYKQVGSEEFDRGKGKYGKKNFLSNIWNGIKNVGKTIWDNIRRPFINSNQPKQPLFKIDPFKTTPPFTPSHIEYHKPKENIELTDIKAPNGRYVTKNDLDYLTNQGYDIDAAKSMLFDHIKYKTPLNEENNIPAIGKGKILDNASFEELKRYSTDIDWNKQEKYNIPDFDNDTIEVIRSKLQAASEKDSKRYIGGPELGKGNTMSVEPQIGGTCTINATKNILRAYTGQEPQFDANDTSYFGSWYSMLKGDPLHVDEKGFSKDQRTEFESAVASHFNAKPNNPIFLYQTGGDGIVPTNANSGNHATVLGRKLSDGTYEDYDSAGGVVHKLQLNEIFDPSAKGSADQNTEAHESNLLLIPTIDPTQPIDNWQGTGQSAAPGAAPQSTTTGGSQPVKPSSQTSGGFFGLIDSLLQSLDIYGNAQSFLQGKPTQNNSSITNYSSSPGGAQGNRLSEEQIWDWFRSKGYSAEATAGIMGRLSKETSGYNPVWEPLHDEGGYEVGGMGIFQWTWDRGHLHETPEPDLTKGREKFPDSRLAKYLKWCDEHNAPYDSTASQLNYFWEQDRENQKWTGYTFSPEEMNDMGIDGAAYHWTKHYERGQVGNEAAYGNEIYNKYKDRQVSTIGKGKFSQSENYKDIPVLGMDKYGFSNIISKQPKKNVLYDITRGTCKKMGMGKSYGRSPDQGARYYDTAQKEIYETTNIPTVTKTDQDQQIWNTLSKIHGPVTAAALMSNMDKMGNITTSFGNFGWPMDKEEEYKEYVRKTHGDLDSLTTQMNYITYLIDHKYQEAAQAMKNQNVDTATAIWTKAFENREPSSYRLNNARKIYATYSGIGQAQSTADMERDAAQHGNSDVLKEGIDQEAITNAITTPSTQHTTPTSSSGGLMGALDENVTNTFGSFFGVVSQKLANMFGSISSVLKNSPIGALFTKLWGDRAFSWLPGGNSTQTAQASSSTTTTITQNNNAPDPNATVVQAPVSGSAGEAMLKMLGLGSEGISSPYGPRGDRIHAGVDYGIDAGTPLPATVDAIVDDCGVDANGYGNYVVLKDKKGYYHIYGHCSDNNKVKTGQKVIAGTIVALSGYSGHCIPEGPDGAHLHYGIYDPQHASCADSEGSIDPMSYSIEGLTSTAPEQGKGKHGKGFFKIHVTGLTKGTDQEYDFSEFRDLGTPNTIRFFDIQGYRGSRNNNIIGTEPYSTQREKYNSQKMWMAKNFKYDTRLLDIKPKTEIEQLADKVRPEDVDKLNYEQLQSYSKSLNYENVPIYNQPDWNNDTTPVIRSKLRTIAEQRQKKDLYGYGKSTYNKLHHQIPIRSNIQNNKNISEQVPYSISTKTKGLDFDKKLSEKVTYGKPNIYQPYQQYSHNLMQTLSTFRGRAKKESLAENKSSSFMSSTIGKILTPHKIKYTQDEPKYPDLRKQIYGYGKSVKSRNKFGKVAPLAVIPIIFWSLLRGSIRWILAHPQAIRRLVTFLFNLYRKGRKIYQRLKTIDNIYTAASVTYDIIMDKPEDLPVDLMPIECQIILWLADKMGLDLTPITDFLENHSPKHFRIVYDKAIDFSEEVFGIKIKVEGINDNEQEKEETKEPDKRVEKPKKPLPNRRNIPTKPFETASFDSNLNIPDSDIPDVALDDNYIKQEQEKLNTKLKDKDPNVVDKPFAKGKSKYFGRAVYTLPTHIKEDLQNMRNMEPIKAHQDITSKAESFWSSVGNESRKGYGRASSNNIVEDKPTTIIKNDVEEDKIFNIVSEHVKNVHSLLVIFTNSKDKKTKETDNLDVEKPSEDKVLDAIRERMKNTANIGTLPTDKPKEITSSSNNIAEQLKLSSEGTMPKLDEKIKVGNNQTLEELTDKYTDLFNKINKKEKPKEKFTLTEDDITKASNDELKQYVEKIDWADELEYNRPDTENDDIGVIRSKLLAYAETHKPKETIPHKLEDTKKDTIQPIITSGISQEILPTIKPKNDPIQTIINKSTKNIVSTQQHKDFSFGSILQNILSSLPIPPFFKNLFGSIFTKSKDRKTKETDKPTITSSTSQEITTTNEKNTEELTDIEAPNGKKISKNDWDYLISQGYTEEAAKELLFAHDKYNKPVEKTAKPITEQVAEAKTKTQELDKTIESSIKPSTEIRELVEEKPIQYNESATAKPSPQQPIHVQSDNISTASKEQLEALIAEQRKTNDLLTQMLSAIINNGKNMETAITNNQNNISSNSRETSFSNARLFDNKSSSQFGVPQYPMNSTRFGIIETLNGIASKIR